ncbi:MAG TPA: OB-fold nucleic acid binding domain-containing protein, partial [Chitinophagaceae bacterium]|nr:OB-fold nucleic acid binding domain-containing protein [Chitinophagaceae bacterium]
MKWDIADLLSGTYNNQDVMIRGWVRNFRNNQFIALNDGSSHQNLQIVAELNRFDDSILKRISTSACLEVRGKLVASQGRGQQVELVAEHIEILGDSDAEKYPL